MRIRILVFLLAVAILLVPLFVDSDTVFIRKPGWDQWENVIEDNGNWTVRALVQDYDKGGRLDSLFITYKRDDPKNMCSIHIVIDTGADMISRTGSWSKVVGGKVTDSGYLNSQQASIVYGIVEFMASGGVEKQFGGQ